ncbi:hypothetical protein C0Q70_20702 [Pomacea canaliculata]|uniref:Uncharacterized protein n=1 Tax=Pomacea canaliculata TaxID=400727 RepID=A0A2T7NGC3_POMCA|nr:hypothetical protein C0Q70_20702 [Pomacea canaliculata]
MADLHDNNRELQEQLQDGQVQLETLLAQKVEAPFLSQLPLNDAGEKMMLSDLLFAGEEIFQRKAAKMGRELRSQLLQARAIIAHHSQDAEAFRREESRDSSTESEDLVRLRQHINQLEDDNAELRKMIGLYRYQHCPSICPVSEPTVLDDESSSPSIFTKESSWPDEMSTDSHSKHVNSERIRWENDDIPSDPDSDSANIQASYDTSNPRAIPVDVGLLQRNLTLERQRSEMWRRLYLKQQRESAKTGSSATKVNASACLQFIQQSFNTSSVLSILSHFNVSGSSIEDFTNLTYLMSSISQMHQNLLQSLPAFWDRVSTSLFDDDKEDDLSEEDVFVKGSGYKSREDSTSSGDAEREKAESVKRYWSDSVRNLLNKTKTTVSNVSEQLKQTWDRVKDASVSLWPDKDSMISRMAAHKHQKAKNKHPHVNIDKKRGHEILEEESKSSINANKKHGDDLFKHRKSTVTDPSMPRIDKIYPDRGSHFDNQAKHQVFRSDKSTEKATRKAEKRFSKLYHRLASMGQRRFAHLGDGDKKEILQDLQDLVDEQHRMGKKLSESGLALLNCQLEWWKGARRGNFIQRRQCLHYLAPWQHQISDSGYIHQTVYAANEKPHISHNSKLEENSKQKKVEDNKDAKERKGKRLEPVKLPEKNSSSAHADWLASQSQSKTVEPGEWLTTHERQAWYFEWVRGRDHLRQEEHRADWMFDRASDRDTNRQSAQTADWLFERAAMRDEARQNEDPENKNTRKFSKDYQSDQRDHQNYRQRYGHKARERQCS